MPDGHRHEAHAREAEERWGDTDAWRQSQQRMGDLGPAGPERAEQWWAAHFEQFAALKRDDVPVEDERVLVAVGDHRTLVNRFYDCDADMQRNLVQMDVSDERFRASYDDHADGLAQYVHDAVMARADDV